MFVFGKVTDVDLTRLIENGEKDKAIMLYGLDSGKSLHEFLHRTASLNT